MYKIERKPDAVVEFEHRIRDEWVLVEAQAWGDSDGIYKTRVSGVFLEGVNVTGLLTDYDLAAIDSEIEAHVLADAGERHATGSDTIPGPYPTF